jgi:hypothetical protein
MPPPTKHYPTRAPQRIIDLLDTMWGEWIGTDRLVREYIDRFGGNRDTVRRALLRVLAKHAGCGCYLVRYGDTQCDERQVFATNPYAREECE